MFLYFFQDDTSIGEGMVLKLFISESDLICVFKYSSTFLYEICWIYGYNSNVATLTIHSLD